MAGVISGGRTGPLDGLTEQHRSSRANQQDAFSRPLGCFAIPALRSRLYQNFNSDYDRLVVRGIKVPLAAGMVSIDVTITPEGKWTPELETPIVKIMAKVTVDDVQSWAFAGGSTSAVIVKLTCVHKVCDGDAASVKKHQDIRKAFSDADTDQSDQYSNWVSNGGFKLLNFQAAAEVIEAYECERELTFALTPGSQQSGHFSEIEAEDVNRQDAEEKRRAKIDPKNRGSDGLGGEDGWGSVFFVFSIFETDATPSLYFVGDNNGGNRDPEEAEAMERMPTSTDELLILELSA